MSEEDDDREFDPTARRLEQAREKGDLPRTNELTGFAALAALAAAAALAGPAAIGETGRRLAGLLASAADRGGIGQGPIEASRVLAAAAPVLMLLLVPGVAVLIALAAVRGIVFAPDRLLPKLGRIDPISTARQRFGRTGLVDFGKAIAKAALLSAVLVWLLRDRLQDIVASQLLAPAPIVVLGGSLILFLFGIATAVQAGIAGFDTVWQWWDHRRRNRMTREEMKQEMRDSEGDPHLKQARRQRAQAIAMNTMLRDTAKADVVIVNPTHYAVALAWKRGSGRAPVCVAKGIDHFAARIREAAALAGVPIHPDPPTARGLFASVEVGEEIRPEHYALVAMAIRFAESVRRRARERG